MTKLKQMLKNPKEAEAASRLPSPAPATVTQSPEKNISSEISSPRKDQLTFRTSPSDLQLFGEGTETVTLTQSKEISGHSASSAEKASTVEKCTDSCAMTSPVGKEKAAKPQSSHEVPTKLQTCQSTEQNILLPSIIMEHSESKVNSPAVGNLMVEEDCETEKKSHIIDRARGKPLGTQVVRKGTTILGYVFDGGIILAGDRRITCGDTDVHGHYYDYIVDDNHPKVMKLSSKGNMFCTLMGSVDHWNLLYDHLRRENHERVEQAVASANQYMLDYRKNNKQIFEDYKSMYGEELSFGTIIGGYHKDTGYQLGMVSIYTNVQARILDSAETLGSGAKYADEILGLNNGSVGRTSYGDHKHMSVDDAFQLAFRALYYSATCDRYSGGFLDALHVCGDSFEYRIQHALDVYLSNYDLKGMDQRTLYIFYTRKKYDHIWGDDDIEVLLSRIWRNSEVVLADLQASHIVTRKDEFHFHRFIWYHPDKALQAYSDVHILAKPPLRPNVIEDEFHGLVRRSGSTDDPIYVARSSIDLLTHTCHMRNDNDWIYR